MKRPTCSGSTVGTTACTVNSPLELGLSLEPCYLVILELSCPKRFLVVLHSEALEGALNI